MPIKAASPPALLQIATSSLALGRSIDHSSLALALCALAFMLWRQPDAWSLAALLGAAGLGIVEKIYALRVAFDQRIFAGLQAQPVDEAALVGFDAALLGLGLRRQSPTPRTLESRIRGALGLLKVQAGLLLLQFALLGAGVVRQGLAA